MDTTTADFEKRFLDTEARAKNSVQLDSHGKAADGAFPLYLESDYPEVQNQIGTYLASPSGQAYMAAKVKEYMASQGTTTPPATTPTTPTTTPTTPAPTTGNMLTSAALVSGCTLTGQNAQQEAVQLVKGTNYVATVVLKSNTGGPCGWQMARADGSGEFYKELKAGQTNTLPFTATATESRKFTIQANNGTAIFSTCTLTPA
jgi:hypothetical protein